MPEPPDAASLREAGVELVRVSTPTCTASAAARTSRSRPSTPSRARHRADRGGHDGRPAPQRRSPASSTASATSGRARPRRRSCGCPATRPSRGAWPHPPPRRAVPARPAPRAAAGDRRRRRATASAPVVAPELEFYLVEPRHLALLRRPRLVGLHVRAGLRPGRRRAGDRCARPATSACADGPTQEYGRGAVRDQPAPRRGARSADRAFRFKAMAKDVAAPHGLLATFMGQLRDDDEGSGLHLHVS